MVRIVLIFDDFASFMKQYLTYLNIKYNIFIIKKYMTTILNKDGEIIITPDA